MDTGGTSRGEKNAPSYKGALWEMVEITAPQELADNCMVLGDFTYIISSDPHSIP